MEPLLPHRQLEGQREISTRSITQDQGIMEKDIYHLKIAILTRLACEE